MGNLESASGPNRAEVFNTSKLRLISEAYGIPGLEYVKGPQSGTITDNAILKDGHGHNYFDYR